MSEETWTRVRSDELLALHRVAQEAREAVEIAEAADVHLGPLRTALDATAYAVPRRRPASFRGEEAS